MRKKNFAMGKGKYYFNVKTGQQSITIKREARDEAELAYKKYISLGKHCEWLGKWNGKEFADTTLTAKKR